MATMSASRGGRTMPSETASAIDTTSNAPSCVRDLGNRRNVFNHAEEVRALDKDGCGFCGDRSLQRGKIDAPVLVVVSQRSPPAIPGAAHRSPAPRGIRDAQSMPLRLCDGP